MKAYQMQSSFANVVILDNTQSASFTILHSSLVSLLAAFGDETHLHSSM